MCITVSLRCPVQSSRVIAFHKSRMSRPLEMRSPQFEWVLGKFADNPECKSVFLVFISSYIWNFSVYASNVVVPRQKHEGSAAIEHLTVLNNNYAVAAPPLHFVENGKEVVLVADFWNSRLSRAAARRFLCEIMGQELRQVN
jgi:hypothetical protein